MNMIFKTTEQKGFHCIWYLHTAPPTPPPTTSIASPGAPPLSPMDRSLLTGLPDP